MPVTFRQCPWVSFLFRLMPPNCFIWRASEWSFDCSYSSDKAVPCLKCRRRWCCLKCHRRRQFFRRYLLPETQFDFNDRKSVTHCQGHYQHSAWSLWYSPMMRSLLSCVFSSKPNHLLSCHEPGKVLTCCRILYWTNKCYYPMSRSNL